MRTVVSLVCAFLALAIASLSPSFAQEEQSTAPYAYRQLDDPAKEHEAKALMETLRCLQCQGQSIADSDAPIAGSMRSLVRERIAKGEKTEDIRAWLIERYGDYVSYAPQLTELTWPLYALPLVLLVLAGFLLRGRFALRKGRDASAGDDTEAGA